MTIWGNKLSAGLTHLADAMADSARNASWDLDVSWRSGLQFGEVTITEVSLLSLVQKIPYISARNQVDGQPEIRTGADFEFWIQGSPNKPWFSFIVQAKKCHGGRGRSVATYDVGYFRGKYQQITQLINTSRRTKQPALYAFYNSPGVDLRKHASSKAPATPYYVRDLCQPTLVNGMDGISILPAHHVKLWLDESKKQAQDPEKRTYAYAADIASDAVPWSCLAACPAASPCAASYRAMRPWHSSTADEDSPADIFFRQLFGLYVTTLNRSALDQPMLDRRLRKPTNFSGDWGNEEDMTTWLANNESYLRHVRERLLQGFQEPPRYVLRREFWDDSEDTLLLWSQVESWPGRRFGFPRRPRYVVALYNNREFDKESPEIDPREPLVAGDHA